MRKAALIAVALAVPASAAAAPVQTMIVGRSAVLLGARTLSVGGATVTAGGHHCGVPAASGLAVLAAAQRAGGPAFRVRQQGGCQGLYVFQVGPDRAGGANGWVYKVGRATPSTGAGERTPQVRAGARVAWFWCRMRGGSCQRTLELTAGVIAKAGRAQRVTVRGYDDAGHGRPIAGALVRLGPVSARTNGSGVATVRAPRPGTYLLTATHAGSVPAFPLGVRVR